MDHSITPVILCGGFGSRLWPLSRAVRPKHLLSLIDEMSMLQNTLLRVHGLFEQSNPIIICNNEHRFIVTEQLSEVGFQKAKIFLEPEGRNTAPAVTMASLHFAAQKQDPILLVMPADHVIKDKKELLATIKTGAILADQGNLVTFGVVPSRPETGYGYILRGDNLQGTTGYHVKEFVEKPTLEKANEYLSSGNYLWNSGIFMFRASVYLNAMKEYAPDILLSCQQVYSEMDTDSDVYRLSENFQKIRSESIDFAVMEKANNIAVVPLCSDWSDVGSWDALWEMGDKDSNGNVLKGQIFTENVKNSYLRSEKRLVAVVGLSDIAVIETSDAVLVTHKDNSQDIKSLVSQLQSQHCVEANTAQRVDRPWGCYETLNKANNYHAKHIIVKPGAKLSLQLHQHRSEHWIIIKGTATVTRGEECFDLSENQTIYIPAKVKHRIENKTDSNLELIEVQTGEYFGEDDITRFDDIYGRRELIA
ncbi:MAG: mannose-1-phosphate guanylyltransferase/mannose-6-phosphate isomerase [Gammaproteobacteria bacterium]|nr:mannose-1-phosphate guanylyltransferase/mannose-6-phosphate isomerase [Gammaproteobacteria bacterium]